MIIKFRVPPPALLLCPLHVPCTRYKMKKKLICDEVGDAHDLPDICASSGKLYKRCSDALTSSAQLDTRPGWLGRTRTSMRVVVWARNKYNAGASSLKWKKSIIKFQHRADAFDFFSPHNNRCLRRPFLSIWIIICFVADSRFYLSGRGVCQSRWLQAAP